MRTGWATTRLLVIVLIMSGFTWAQRGLGTLQITSPTLAVQVGGATTTLSAQRVFAKAPTRTLPVSARWYSSNPSVATVGLNSGVVNPVGVGTATIMAVSGPFTSTTSVEVVPSGAVTALAISSPDTSIAKGLTEQYTATATINGSPVDVTAVALWNSSLTGVAPINAAGLAKGMAVGGPSNITASFVLGGASTPSNNTLQLTVTAAVLQSVTISPSPIFMGAGNTLQLKATGHWTDGDRDETSNTTWSSSDTTNVATITAAGGLITAIGAGTSHAANAGTITATRSPLASQNIPISVMTTAEAGRFLEQATFGASPADVAHLQSMGFDAWLTEQFNMAQAWSNYPVAPDIPTIQNQFYFNALKAPDQLRQRAAFALEQMWVISSNKVTDPNAFVPWQNMMERDAFGNYRTLMHDVTLSPAMGVYLDMVNNDKPVTSTSMPNENYARELLQLFTIGLYQLNPDGTQVLSGGNPVPTYDESIVQGFAHVYTGWTFPTKPNQVRQKHNSAYYGVAPYGSPMENFASNYDTTSTKKLLNGVTLPANSSPTAAQDDLNAALDNIFQDTTLAPFVCQQLIEHLVKSNPSPTYVSGVVGVFNNDGTGTAGNMQAVLKAILMDPEARAGDFQAPGTVPLEGHLREPVLFMTSVERSLSSTDTGTSLEFLGSTMGQDVINSPTVFNFYPPNYVIPQNYFNPAQIGVVGPEFALETPTTAVDRVNFVSSVVFSSSISATVNSYKPLAGNAATLVDALNQQLMHGQMSSAMRTSIINAVNFYSATSTTSRVQAAMFLILSSSQYQVQH